MVVKKRLPNNKLNEVLKSIADRWTKWNDIDIHQATVSRTLSEAQRGKKHSEAMKQAQSVRMKGVPRRKIYRGKGVVFTEEQKLEKEIYIRMKMVSMFPDIANRQKQWKEGFSTGVIIEGVEYESIKAAAEALNIPRTAVTGKIRSKDPKYSNWNLKYPSVEHRPSKLKKN